MSGRAGNGHSGGEGVSGTGLHEDGVETKENRCGNEGQAEVEASKTSQGSSEMKDSVLKSSTTWDVRIPPAVNSVQGQLLPKILHSTREWRISVEVRTRLYKSTEAGEANTAKTNKTNKTSKSDMSAAAPRGLVNANGVSTDDFTVVRMFLPATSKEARAIQEAVTTLATATTHVAQVPAALAHAHAHPHQQHLHDVDVNQVDDTSSVSTLGVRGVDDAALTRPHSAAPAPASTPKPTPAPTNTNTNTNTNTTTNHNPPLQQTHNNTNHTNTNHNQNHNHGWVQKYNMPLKNLTIHRRLKNICVVTTQPPNAKKKTREIIFQNEKQAQAFDRIIKHEKKAELERSRMHIRAALGGKKIIPSESIHLLVEIVSAWDLAIGDVKSSDPFVRVKMGDFELHRTAFIPNTLNPIWTVKTGSLFIIATTSKQLFRCYEGISFEVRDYDALKAGSSLGVVMVPPSTLYEGKGERWVFPLKESTNLNQPAKGTLVLRCRHATQDDLKFMEDLARQEKQEDPMGHARPKVKGGLTHMLHRNHRTEKGVKKIRVRPGPDPRRKDTTEWMTEDDLQRETFDKSHTWLDAGSGKLGRVHVEVLGCDHLPNLDAGGMVGNKTDAFAALVFEDCVVQTDVIEDSLSPRWLPWMQRAFVFNVMHSSSQLYVGVFDFDPSSINLHDEIGRVAVDVSNLTPNTECVLYYNLYKSSVDLQRKPQGTITFRIRVEWDDERQLLLSNLQVPPEIFVNCRQDKDFHLMRYACDGKFRKYQYNMKTILLFLEELQSYQLVLFYIQEAAIALLFWRGTVTFTVPLPSALPLPPSMITDNNDNSTTNADPDAAIDADTDNNNNSNHTESTNRTTHTATFKEKLFTLQNVTLTLPLHSAIAFLMFATLAEKPRLIPSFWMGSIAWMMLAVMSYKMHHPSPWRRCRSFQELFLAIVIGKTFSKPQRIVANQNEEEFQKFVKYWEDKIEKMQKLAAKRNEENLKRQQEIQQELTEIGADQDIAAIAGGMSIDPLKPVLFPIQQNLAYICDILRVIRNVILWEECYLSFWVTFASLALSFLFLFVPWVFIVRWVSRLVVWLLFGPHMYFVDKYWYSQLPEADENDVSDAMKLQTEALILDARMRKENATKIKDMKVYKFGSHITRVPVLKVDRLVDKPLSQSYATPYKDEQMSMVERAFQEAGMNRVRVPGQHLVGDMIPKLEEQPVTTAPVGQPTKEPFSARNESTVAAVASATGDSNISVLMKIGTVVVVASVLTWYGVPYMALAVHLSLEGMARGVSLGVIGVRSFFACLIRSGEIAASAAHVWVEIMSEAISLLYQSLRGNLAS